MSTKLQVPRGNHIYDEVIDRVGERSTLLDTLRSVFFSSVPSPIAFTTHPLVAFSHLRNAFAVTVAEDGCLAEIHVNLDGQWLHPPLYNKHQGYAISQLSWCPYSDTLIAATETGVCVWRLFGLAAADTEKSWMSHFPSLRQCAHLAPCPHGRVIAVTSAVTSQLTLYDISTLQQSVLSCAEVKGVNAMAWCPSADFILVGSSDGVVTLIRCANWEQEVLYQLPTSITSIAYLSSTLALLGTYSAVYPLTISMSEDIAADIAPVPFAIADITLQALRLDNTLHDLTKQILQTDAIETSFKSKVSIASLQASPSTPHVAATLRCGTITLPYVVIYLYNNKHNFTMLVHRVCVADEVGESDQVIVPVDIKFRPSIQRGRAEVAILWSSNSMTFELC